MTFVPKPNISDDSSQKEISAEIETVGNVQQHRNRIVFEQKNEAPKPEENTELNKSTITAQVKAVLTKLDYSTAGILLGLKNSGCPFNMTRHIKIDDCSGQGFYDYRHQTINLCQKHWLKSTNEGELREFLVRNLVSAYDHCQTDISKLSEEQYLDFRNCSQIRQFTLSKTCDYEAEGSSKMKEDGFKFCVLENSSSSLENSLPEIYKTENIEDSFRKVFLSCYEDKRPFDRVPTSRRDWELALKDLTFSGNRAKNPAKTY
ncbi:Oidioi.mRNA.OKI2018_I69.XSR.g15372.t1.cds [Oikopleura dioica]|uniref:Mitochondrial inner membrane protease ATP23 n=1 Tax=Oikopleura dioica TaxID=34765 RepID=A0ABN7SLU7_OIKDI|nr:Oidioi.mRNA.OKI2018_I69.XSR.g15372.t1.cds [Oikopleura dioica]